MESLAGKGRDGINGKIHFLEGPKETRKFGLGLRGIDFVEGDNLWFLSQIAAEQGELPVQYLVVLQGVAPGEVRNINQMDDQRSPFHMAQKLKSQSDAAVGALDDSRNVGDDKRGLILKMDHAQMGNQRREGIIGNFRPNGGDLGDQGGFPYIGKADDSHVGHELQFEAKPFLFPRKTGLGMSGGLQRRRGESGVAPSSPSSPRHDESLSILGEVFEELARLFIPNESSHRDGNHAIGSASSLLIFPSAMLASLGGVLTLVMEINEGCKLGISP